jgi:putative ABC transport system substrate-binding protein
MSAVRSLSRGKRTWLGEPCLVEIDPERTSAPPKYTSFDAPRRLPTTESRQLHCHIPNFGAGMKRREFIAAIGGAAVWPQAARAQQREPLRRVGVLMGYAENDSEAQEQLAAFRDGFQKLGWTEGRNIRIDTRWTIPAEAELMQRFAKERVALQPDVILSSTTQATTALLQQTHTIPIVFATVGDPIGGGFVASFSRPGENAAGFSVSEPTQAEKWVELQKAIAPHVVRVAMLFNPASATYAEYWLKPFKAAAAYFGMEAISAHGEGGQFGSE